MREFAATYTDEETWYIANVEVVEDDVICVEEYCLDEVWGGVDTTVYYYMTMDGKAYIVIEQVASVDEYKSDSPNFNIAGSNLVIKCYVLEINENGTKLIEVPGCYSEGYEFAFCNILPAADDCLFTIKFGGYIYDINAADRTPLFMEANINGNKMWFDRALSYIKNSTYYYTYTHQLHPHLQY